MADARQHQHPKLKKYVVIKPVDPTGLPGVWVPGEVVRVDPSEVPHYIAGGFIVPLDVAIRNGQYDPTAAKPSLMTKVSQAAFGPTKTSPEPEKSVPEQPKTLISNPLSQAVQDKKAKSEETKSTTKAAVSADKLAAIKAGGK